MVAIKWFQFLKTICDASNSSNVIVEDKLSNILLSAKRPIHNIIHYSPSLKEINEDLKSYNATVTIKPFRSENIQKALNNLPGLPWS